MSYRDDVAALLGEASHGTHEFYRWRARLTQRLIAEKGFSFVAWPDCDRIDRAVRCLPDAPEDPRPALAAFERWPTWMWANEEVLDFCRWLRAHNAARDPAGRVGFHGLDVYSLWESLREILTYLGEHDPEQVPVALAAYRCFEPHDEDARSYAIATRFASQSFADEVVDLLVRLRERAADGAGTFGAWQNAEVVAGAEQYYRAMVGGGRQSWNVRDRHMDRALDRLLTHYGSTAKAVVWTHNTHVGDARATTMAAAGEVNLGQLARERFGADQVVLVGFGTHRGTVVAGDAWGAPPHEVPVPPARRGSLEDALHRDAPAAALLADELPHRAIGVVYHPERERWGNYVLGDRYDAFLWFDDTAALRPLPTHHVNVLEPETYPSGS